VDRGCRRLVIVSVSKIVVLHAALNVGINYGMIDTVLVQ